MFFRALNGNSSGDCIMHTNYQRPSSIRSVDLLNGKQFFQSLSTYAHSTAGIHKPGALELKTFGFAVVEDSHVSSCPSCFLPKDTNALRSTTLLLSPVSLLI